jgi:anti-sigma regulatory factor (Ser/Thr protein kinase)
VVALTSFWGAVVTRKGGPAHRRWGFVFSAAIYTAASQALGMGLLSLVWPLAMHPQLTDEVLYRGMFGTMMVYLGLLAISMTRYGLMMVVNRRDHDANRNACLGEAADGLQPSVRRCCARFDPTGERVVQVRDRDVGVDAVRGGHGRQVLRELAGADQQQAPARAVVGDEVGGAEVQLVGGVPGLELDLADVDVTAVCSAAVAMVSPAVQKKGLTLRTMLDGAVSRVRADERRLTQILVNLLSNAVKYNVDGGNIVVRSRVTESQVIEIMVSDSGLGMTRAQMDELFQPYNRLGRERTAVEGTAALIILTPIFAPVALKFGIDPVHFGVVLVMNLTIAGITPPVGQMMFISCAVMRVPMEVYTIEIMPFLGAMFAVLGAITYVPALVTFLPNALMGVG